MKTFSNMSFGEFIRYNSDELPQKLHDKLLQLQTEIDRHVFVNKNSLPA